MTLGDALGDCHASWLHRTIARQHFLSGKLFTLHVVSNSLPWSAPLGHNAFWCTATAGQNNCFAVDQGMSDSASEHRLGHIQQRGGFGFACRLPRRLRTLANCLLN
mmetsp:Transcript_24751/g.82706  ORF Transcript_24751/g.82706 Transcript_24751/m.82706 type:complete len:106 (-) Transcript_24751:8-325(-)